MEEEKEIMTVRQMAKYLQISEVTTYSMVQTLSSRGLNSLQEFVLGSVSHKVAKRASCPVLIVK